MMFNIKHKKKECIWSNTKFHFVEHGIELISSYFSGFHHAVRDSEFIFLRLILNTKIHIVKYKNT